MKRLLIPFLVLTVSLNLLILSGHSKESFNSAAVTTTNTVIASSNGTYPSETTYTSSALHVDNHSNATFYVKVNPSVLILYPGSSGIYAVTVLSTGSQAEDVHLSVADLPEKVEGKFNLENGAPNPLFTSILTIKSDQTTPPGKYDISIIARSENFEKTESATLLITQKVETTWTRATNETGISGRAFILEADPARIRVKEAGESAVYKIEVKSVGGFDGVVMLGAHGLPQGAIPIFNPNEGRISSHNVFRAKLRVRTSPDTPPGVYTLIVSGAHGAQVNFVTVGLIIESGSKTSVTTTSKTSILSTLLVSTSASQDNYNPGETCHIFGYVKTQYGAMVEGAPVSIQVINPQGAAIHIASTKTDGSGYYSNLFTLSSNAQTGTYTIYVTASKAGYNKGFRTNVFTVGESHTPGVSIESLYTTTPDESEQEEFYPGQTVVIWVAVKNAGADLRKARIWIEVADPNGIPLTVLVSVQDLGRGRDAKIGIQFPLGAQAPRGTYKVSSYVSTGLISEGGKFLAYEQTIFIVS